MKLFEIAQPIPRPTTTQMQVLAAIIGSPTPVVAYETISTGQHMIAARDILMRLRLIDLADGEAALTDAGAKVAVDENIMDESGQLTQFGQQLMRPLSGNTPVGTDSQQIAAVPIDPAIGGDFK